MKLRTITTGMHLDFPLQNQFKKIASFNQMARKVFEREGYEVQTTRIATQSWEEYLAQPVDIKKIENACEILHIDFISIGPTRSPDKIGKIETILQYSSHINVSVEIGNPEKGILYQNIREAAKLIVKVAEITDDGIKNFSLAATANCPPGIPFFPASYHQGREPMFSIGIECSDLLMRALSRADSLKAAHENLLRIMNKECEKIEKIAKNLEEEITYNGIDVSICPSLEEQESTAFAFEKLGLGTFGEHGTIAIAAMITDALKRIRVKRCGYSGLMLPVLEDFGLAHRASEGTFSTQHLLCYSSVCGTGLDVVPIPGDTSEKKIAALLLDVASLGLKLDKPLSARVLPIPGKTPGEMTDFKSPYLVNCKILSVR